MEGKDVNAVLFGSMLGQALGGGLVGVAVVDKFGTTVDIAGDITEDEAQPLAALIMFTLKGPDLAERLFAGDVLTLELDGREGERARRRAPRPGCASRRSRGPRRTLRNHPPMGWHRRGRWRGTRGTPADRVGDHDPTRPGEGLGATGTSAGAISGARFL